MYSTTITNTCTFHSAIHTNKEILVRGASETGLRGSLGEVKGRVQRTVS